MNRHARLALAASSLAGASVLACRSPSAAPSEPRPIVVGPVRGAAAPNVTSEVASTGSEVVAPFDLGLGRTMLCVRAAGRVHCSDALETDRPLTASPPLDGIEDATQLAMGHDFGCAVTRAGAVLCFGNNSDGQLGAKLRADRSDRPVAVVGVASAKQVTVGFAHACALLDDGAVRCWGRNDSGQTAGRTSYLPAAHELVGAEPVERVTDARAVVASGRTTCTLGRSPPQTWCWGQPSLADHTIGQAVVNERPVVVPELAHFDEIAANEGAFCGIRDEDVQCWGKVSMLARGPTMDEAAMVSMHVPRARHVRLGQSFACALVEGGAISCWGAGYSGALGRGETKPGFAALPPEIVKGIPPAVGLATGESMACAITGAREVYCWGSWRHGGMAERREPSPVRVRVTE